MAQLQEIYNRIQETKKKQKEIRDIYKDALAGVAEYQEIGEKMKTMRARKKQIELAVKQQFSAEITKLEDMKVDMESDVEMLTDMAVSEMLKGNTVEVTDIHNNQFVPQFRVTFKKVL